VSKGPELSNPLDLNSAPTGNTCFILTEIYESKGWCCRSLRADDGERDFPAMGKWMKKCKVTFVPAASIINSLW
jgi:hypothetical protein